MECSGIGRDQPGKQRWISAHRRGKIWGTDYLRVEDSGAERKGRPWLGLHELRLRRSFMTLEMGFSVRRRDCIEPFVIAGS